MAKILLGNQWGGGVGHVRNLRALADRMQTCGHQPVLALPDLVAARPALQDVKYPFLQGPVWRGALRPRKQTRTFADIMANQAFADENVYSTLVNGWSELIELTKPDLVVVKYAPLLSLAAHDRVPVVAIGSPFCLPPSDCKSFPVLNSEAPAAYSEDDLLLSINTWLTQNGRSNLNVLPEIHPSAHNYPIGLEEMDPYREFRPKPVLSPLPDSLPKPLDSNQPGGPPRLFCYLDFQHKPGIRLLTMLAKGGININVYLKNGNPVIAGKLRQLGVTVDEEHVPIRDALSNAHILLHNGSTILAYEALAMGRAQLCFPMDLEKELNSRNLHRLGVAKMIRPPDLKPQVIQQVKDLCSDPELHLCAQNIARDLAERDFDNPIDQIMDRLNI